MPSLSGALGGASTGAQIGAVGGPVGMAVGAGIGGLIGAFTGGTPKYIKEMQSKINPVQSNLIHWSGEDMDMARLFRTLGIDQSQGVDKYLRGVLSANDAQAFNALVGNQRTGITKSYQQVLDNVSKFAPRGGGRGAAGMEYDFQKAGQMLEATAAGRAQAVGQLNQAAGQNTNAGIQFGQSATQRSGTVLDSIASTLTGQQANARANSAANGQSAYQLGQLLGPMIQDIFKGGGSGGGNTRPRIV